MREGTCPKCGSNEVYRSSHHGGVWAQPEQNRYYVWTDGGELRDEGCFFVCANCGYLEQYLEQSVVAGIAASTSGRTWAKVVPAGWYGDPVGRHEVRYWDGQSWTAHVRDGETGAEDPLPA